MLSGKKGLCKSYPPKKLTAYTKRKSFRSGGGIRLYAANLAAVCYAEWQRCGTLSGPVNLLWLRFEGAKPSRIADARQVWPSKSSCPTSACRFHRGGGISPTIRRLGAVSELGGETGFRVQKRLRSLPSGLRSPHPSCPPHRRTHTHIHTHTICLPI